MLRRHLMPVLVNAANRGRARARSGGNHD
jgi:hypothetical protein